MNLCIKGLLGVTLGAGPACLLLLAMAPGCAGGELDQPASSGGAQISAGQAGQAGQGASAGKAGGAGASGTAGSEGQSGQAGSGQAGQAGQAGGAPVIPYVPPCSSVPFIDATHSSGLDAFKPSTESDDCSLRDTFGGGACLFDLDGDGDLDAYFTNMGAAPNALFVNDGKAHFTPVPGAAGAAVAGQSYGCLAFDYDGDGDDDLFVSTADDDHLFRNDGGSLVEVTAAAGLGLGSWGISSTAGDIDGDGDLDLIVGRNLDASTCKDVTCHTAPHTCQAQRNLVYVNQGDGTFTEESLSRGLVEEELTLAVRLWDIDHDGDLDLYVGNDEGTFFDDRFYINDGAGHFVDRAPEMGLNKDNRGISGETMSVDMGDLDNDGRFQLASTALAGDPIYLYRCDLDLHCQSATTEAGLAPSAPEFKWGLLLDDFDHDGDRDMLVATGVLELPGGQADLLFWKDGAQYTRYQPSDDEALGQLFNTRGIYAGDLDDDGNLDVLASQLHDRPQLLLGRSACGHWLGVELDSLSLGARVRVTTPDRTVERQIPTAGSFAGIGSKRVHVGLGDRTSADVEVIWVGGAKKSVKGVAADQVLRLGR